MQDGLSCNFLVMCRPLQLPLRSLLSLGSFSISSNLAAQTRTSSLRFIAEEGALFLSNRTGGGAPQLRTEYVCVLELGLFELSLRLSEDPRAPKVSDLEGGKGKNTSIYLFIYYSVYLFILNFYFQKDPYKILI